MYQINNEKFGLFVADFSLKIHFLCIKIGK